MRKWGRKLLGLLLCTIMIAGLLPGTLSLARAEEEKAITGLGTGAITNPASGAGGWSKVYFGSKDNPILFNVLTTNTSNFGGTTMLLQTQAHSKPMNGRSVTSEPGLTAHF